MHDNLRLIVPRPTGRGRVWPERWSSLMLIAGTWMSRRRQRRALLGLNDHLLKDIGISRSEAFLEGSKPFWRR